MVADLGSRDAERCWFAGSLSRYRNVKTGLSWAKAAADF
jgi:hypothetical protein